MTDRELLELAARAARVDVKRWDGHYASLENGDDWLPLYDDGDAFRLAVKLGVFMSPRFHHFRAIEGFGRKDTDDCALVRRAIVRSAAEIGKAMD